MKTNQSTEASQKNVAIVGGGFTGLVAALRLAKAGRQVTVFEAGDVPGGLAASFRMGGEPLEKAYHHLFRTDEDILALIKELGLEENMEWCRSSMAIYRDGRNWPFMTPLDLLRFGPCSFLGRIRLGFTALRIKHLKNWRSLQNSQALAWMRSACGKSASETVWEPLLRGKFAHHAESVSMAWLWARLHIRSNSREPGGGDEKLGYINGGFVKIVEGLQRELEARGGSIRCNARVSSIERENQGFRVSSGDRQDDFDSVIFTGPNGAFDSLVGNFPEMADYRRSLGKIEYLNAICMVFDSDQALGEHYWTNVNEPDAPFLVFIRHTRLVPAARYGGKEIYYLGAYVAPDDRRFALSDSDLKSEWFDYLSKMYPAFEASKVGELVVHRFRHAQHVVGRGYEEAIPAMETPVPGLYLSNFTQVFPEDRGTNYAVREGETVAGMVDSWLSDQ